MRVSRLFGIGDLFLVVLVVLAFVFSLRFIGQTRPFPTSVLVLSSGKENPPLALSKDNILDITGPLGNTRIEIVSGSVHVVDSPCPQKLCVKAGWIRNSGEWIVCVPNRIYVQIRGADIRRLDGVTQ